MTTPSKPPAAAGNDFGQYSLREFLTIVFKRRLLILGILLTAVTVAAFVTLQTPRMYKVTATLMFNEARAEMPIAPTESAQYIVKRVNQEDLNSEIEVLRSRKLIGKVVRRLSIEEPLEVESSSGGVERLDSTVGPDDDKKQQVDFDAVVLGVQSGLYISVIRNSNLLRLSYQSTDAAWATRVVETLTDEYLKQRAERYQSPQTVLFFEQQMNDAEQRLKQHTEALEEFADEASFTLVESSAGTDSLAVQKNSVMERLSTLEGSLGNAEVELESQLRQVASLQEMLRNEPERLDSSSQMDINASTYEIERALTALKLERDRLLQDFKPDSRHVRDIDSQIKMAEDRLGQAKAASEYSGTVANPVFLELKGELLRAEVSLEGTRAQVASLRAQAVEYRKKLAPLNALAFDLEILQRNAQTAEEDFLRYRQKHEEARISMAMDKEKFINVTVAQPAQKPLNSEPRKVASKMVLSVIVGLLGGVGLAFGKEMFLDRSFTTAEDLEKRLGIPHIASIPDGETVG